MEPEEKIMLQARNGMTPQVMISPSTAVCKERLEPFIKEDLFHT